MKRIELTWLVAWATIITCSASAQAAPQVSGQYAGIGYTFCSARISAKSGNVTSKENGVLNVLNGYVTFTPSSATKGTVSSKLTQIRGPNTTVNASNSGWQTAPLVLTGTYTITANSLTLAGESFHASYANIVGGTARSVNLSRRETGPNPDCVDAIMLTKTQ